MNYIYAKVLRQFFKISTILALFSAFGSSRAGLTSVSDSRTKSQSDVPPAFACGEDSWVEFLAPNHVWVRTRQSGNHGRVCRTRRSGSTSWFCPTGYTASQQAPYCIFPPSNDKSDTTKTAPTSNVSPVSYQIEPLSQHSLPSIGRGGGCYAEDALGPPIGGNPDPMPGEGPWVRPYRTELSTPKQCSATRTVPGHPLPLNLLRRKLADCGKDVEVAVIGGSVSCGKCQSHRRDGCCAANELRASTPEEVQTFRNGGCVEEAWPARLQTVLREWRQRLCRASNTTLAMTSGQGRAQGQVPSQKSGTLGSVVVLNHCKAACGSNYFVHRIAGDPTFLYSADLIIAETSTNDVSDIKGADRQKGLKNGAKGANPMENVQQMWTEVLVRQLLRLPQRPALLWLGAAWRAFSNERGGNVTEFPSRHQCTIAAQAPVLRHYGVPQVSLVEAFMPVTTTARMKWMTNVYFVDRLHPSVIAHKFIASTVAYNLLNHPLDSFVDTSMDYLNIALHDSLVDHADVPRPALVLPKALMVSDAMARTYEAKFERLDLSNPVVTAAAAVPFSPRPRTQQAANITVYGSGFSIYEDVPKKPGLIATTAGASVIFRLSPPKIPKSTLAHSKNVYRPWLVAVVGYLSSYSNMAEFEIGVSAQSGSCPTDSSGWKPSADEVFLNGRIDGLIEERLSVYTTKVLSGRLPQEAGVHLTPGSDICIWLQAHALGDHLRGKSSKVKLYDISWTWTDQDPES